MPEGAEHAVDAHTNAAGLELTDGCQLALYVPLTTPETFFFSEHPHGLVRSDEDLLGHLRHLRPV